MSLSSGSIATVAFVYMAFLFAIAFYGDRRRRPLSPRTRAWVYSLSLAVYCTSWTFFGAVGQAAEQLWAFLPIYLGPLLLMIFAPWVLQKMVMISKQENITSIADFIAARYGKSQSLAVVVALICMVGVLPYIALQLKGIVIGVNLLIGAGADSTGTRAQDTALIVSLVLALITRLAVDETFWEQVRAQGTTGTPAVLAGSDVLAMFLIFAVDVAALISLCFAGWLMEKLIRRQGRAREDA